MFQFDFSVFEACEDIDLLSFIVRQKHEAPAAIITLSLIAFDVLSQETDICRHEHRILPLANINYEWIVLRSFAQPALNSCARIGRQIGLYSLTEILVDDERLLLLAHQWHSSNCTSVENKRRIFEYNSSIGGERSSTTRQRLAGKICAICSRSLPEPHTAGERRCSACGVPHLVYMSFMLRDGWFCQFLERDLKTPLPRKITLKDPESVRALAERGGCVMNLEKRHAFDYAIGMGRGGVWLELTEEQYLKLKA